MAALAGGWMPFLVSVILFLVGAIIALYTRKGSGMDHHPYRDISGGAPAAALPCDDYSGSDRTYVTEGDVGVAWRRERLGQSPASVAAQRAQARTLRHRQRPRVDGSRGLPITSPVAPLH